MRYVLYYFILKSEPLHCSKLGASFRYSKTGSSTCDYVRDCSKTGTPPSP